MDLNEIETEKTKGSFPGLKRIAERKPYNYLRAKRIIKFWKKREIMRAINKGKTTAHLIHHEWVDNKGYSRFRSMGSIHMQLIELYDIGILRKLPKIHFKDQQQWTFTDEGKSLFITDIGED